MSHPAQYYNWANIISSYALTQGSNYLGISPDQVDGTTYTGCWSKGRMQVDELWLSLKDAHTHDLKVAPDHYIQVHAMLQKSFTGPIGPARYLLLA